MARAFIKIEQQSWTEILGLNDPIALNAVNCQMTDNIKEIVSSGRVNIMVPTEASAKDYRLILARSRARGPSSIAGDLPRQPSRP